MCINVSREIPNIPILVSAMFIAAESCVISSFAIATDSLSTECNIPDAPRDS